MFCVFSENLKIAEIKHLYKKNICLLPIDVRYGDKYGTYGMLESY